MRTRIVTAALVATVLALSLAVAAAVAGKGDPQKRINTADQARARAMLLKSADLGPLFGAAPSGSSGNTGHYCAALDESDLTLTGKADSPRFTYSVAFVSSEAQVYASVRDGAAAFGRETSTAGISCVKAAARREFARQGLRLVSFRKRAFPRVSQRTASYRVVLSGQAQGITVKVFLDVIALLHSRAEVSLAVGAGLAPAAAALEVRLARTLAARMKTAMRGA